ncbi:MAG: hypothetical protein ACLQLC_06920 [Candidatus Sulfotelmatobacter sp.]
MNYVTVGTDHKLQKSDSANKGLRNILQSILQNNDVVLIAEEVETSNPVQTFGRELVGEDRWLSIDMNDDERKVAGICNALLHSGAPVSDPRTGEDVRQNDYHQVSEGKRENHWLDKIENWCKEKGISEETVISPGVVVHTPKTVILVCGDNHLPFVGSKISARGHSVVQLKYLPYDKENEQGLFTIFND